MRDVFGALLFASAVLAASHRPSPSVVYVTLSSTPAPEPSIVYVTLSNTPAPSPSIIYVTVGAPHVPPSVSGRSHITSPNTWETVSTPSESAATVSTASGGLVGDPASTGVGIPSGYTVETYAVPYETGSTVGSSASTTDIPDADPSAGADPDLDPVTVTDTVTVTQNVTVSASNTDTWTSIYLPVFTTSSSSRRHRFF